MSLLSFTVPKLGMSSIVNENGFSTIFLERLKYEMFLCGS